MNNYATFPNGYTHRPMIADLLRHGDVLSDDDFGFHLRVQRVERIKGAVVAFFHDGTKQPFDPSERIPNLWIRNP